MSLLELVIASALLATMVTSVGVLMRTGRDAWQAHEDDHARLEAAHATVRHIVRRARQALAVTAISAAADTSGTLSLSMPSGDTLVWDHDDGADEVNYGVTTATDLLAENITQLTFTGYEADGTTPTTVVEDIQSIEVEAQVVLPRETDGTKTVRSWAWVRTW